MDPPAEQVRREITEYARTRSASGDIFVFYFSGHGLPVGHADLGLCMTDTQIHPFSGAPLPLSLVTISEVLATLSAADVIPVFIIDACYSAIAARTLSIPAHVAVDSARRELQSAAGSRYALVAACAEYETARDSRDGGIFTIALERTVRERLRTPKPETFSLRQIFPELERTLGAQSEDSRPRLFLGDTLPDFPLVRDPEHRPQRWVFGSYYGDLLRALLQEGPPYEIAVSEIVSVAGNSAYGNHRKLSQAPWDFLEDAGPRRRRLSDRGRRFAAGEFSIPSALIFDGSAGSFVADPQARQIHIGDL
jgi:hypothetical protein